MENTHIFGNERGVCCVLTFHDRSPYSEITGWTWFVDWNILIKNTWYTRLKWCKFLIWQKQKNGSSYCYWLRLGCCWHFLKICKLFNSFKKIRVSLYVCFSRDCSCYTNLAKNNFSIEYFQHLPNWCPSEYCN